MMIVSLAMCVVEYSLLAFFPSIAIIFITKVLSGIADCGISIGYTIGTDIAFYNDDEISTIYGYMGATMGLALILGPVSGGIICDYSIRLCFIIGGVMAIVALVSCYIWLEESLDYNTSSLHTPYHEIPPENEAHPERLSRPSYHNMLILKKNAIDWSEVNPIPALVLHLKNKKLRQLSIPLFIATFTTGIAYVWFVYMQDRYNASTLSYGLFISYFGFLAVIVQGFIMERIIPSRISASNAAIVGLILASVQTFLFGFSQHIWGMYVITFVFCLNTMYDPSLKSLIITESRKYEQAHESSRSLSSTGMSHQGNLQGILGSLRTLALALGSSVFNSLYGFSIHDEHGHTWLAFVIAGSLYGITGAYIYYLVHVLNIIDDSTMDDNVVTTNTYNTSRDMKDGSVC